MPRRIEVVLSPAELAGLAARDLAGAACVVFDVLRATSSIVTALAADAEAVLPVGEIAEAIAVRSRRPDVLLAGEREGLRIGAALAGGVEFDLGNSPREFVRERVAGRTIVMTTTNGTRALRVCRAADHVLAACLLNLDATARHVARLPVERVVLVCAGTFDEAAFEDIFAAGGVCDRLAGAAGVELADAAAAARAVWRGRADDPRGAIGATRNGRRLLGMPELAADVAFCARVDAVPLVALARPDGAIARHGGAAVATRG